MHARSSGNVLLALGLLGGGCTPPWDECPTGRIVGPSLVIPGGSLEVALADGLRTFSLDTASAAADRCTIDAEPGTITEEMAEASVPTLFSIDCGTSLVPVLHLSLPDVRDLSLDEEAPEGNATLSFDGQCPPIAGVPITWAVAEAVGGRADFPSVVTSDFLRDVASDLHADPQPGVPHCLAGTPAIDLTVQMVVAASDYRRTGDGCL